MTGATAVDAAHSRGGLIRMFQLQLDVLGHLRDVFLELIRLQGQFIFEDFQAPLELALLIFFIMLSSTVFSLPP